MAHIPMPPSPNGPPTWVDWLRLINYLVAILGWPFYGWLLRRDRKRYYRS